MGVSSKSFLRAISASITCSRTEQLISIIIINLARAATLIFLYAFSLFKAFRIYRVFRSASLHDGISSLMQACIRQYSKRKC